MQSLENQYQSSPNFLKLRYPILSLLVHQALHFMINQKVFPMLEMPQEKEPTKLLKEKREKQFQEIKQIVMLNPQIYWNLTVIQQNLHLIHAIWFWNLLIELILDSMSTSWLLFLKRSKLSLSSEYLLEEKLNRRYQL